MKIVVDFSSPALRSDDRLFAQTVRCLIEVATLVNRDYIQRFHPPELYSSGVFYQNEKIGVPDRLEDIPTIIRRGHGDCLHLVAWRVAELRAAGEFTAKPRIIWLPAERRATPQRVFHVLVRRASGLVEDPSLKLGMPS